MKNIYYIINIEWVSTKYTKLKKLDNKQKHVSRIIFHQDKKSTHARPLMKKLSAINIYRLNIYNKKQNTYSFILDNFKVLTLRLLQVPRMV